MGAVTTHHLLALDGGNSKTDVLLLTGDGTVVARAKAGPFAPHIVGATTAVAGLAAAVAEVLAAAGIARADLVAGYLANADLPEEETAIAAAISDLGWGEHVVVENDTLAMLRAGTDAPVAVAVVCGGGINGVGVGRDGARVRFPALGRATGDWGGGFGLAKEALFHAARAEDGRGAPTALAPAIAVHFDVALAVDVATGMHLGHIDRDRMHELVPVLFAVADAGDPLAVEVVDRQADEIALIATAAIRRLDLADAAVTVVLGGGVMRGGTGALLARVHQRILEVAPLADISLVDDAPVLGSALLGLEHLDRIVGTTGDAAARRARLRATLLP